MAAEQRKLLEQLMGAGASSRQAQLALTDPKVCRSYLAGTCPHDLFTNTKQDLGPCARVHSEQLKTEYDEKDVAEKRRLGFEYDYVRDMQKYIDDCNRRIDAAQRRLEKTPEEIRQSNALLKQIGDLTDSVAAGLIEVQMLAETSAVSLAVTEHHKIRVARASKEEKERELKSIAESSGPSGHQKLQVCDVCGAYLSRLDNDRRLADHFAGKMHLGYAQMRRTHEALQKELKSRPPAQRDDRPRREDDDRGDDRSYGGRSGGHRGGGRRNRW